MCEILGSFNLPTKIFKEGLQTASRYDHSATGLGCFIQNKLITSSQSGDAENFLIERSVRKILSYNPRLLIGHCRTPTQGSPENPLNNHPIRYKNFALIHKGVISNDKILRKIHHLKRRGEVDSQVIVQLIDKFYQERESVVWAIRKTQQLLEGTWACALLNKGKPNQVYLFSSFLPIWVCYSFHYKGFLFTTDLSIIDEFFGNKDILITKIEDMGLILGKKLQYFGLEFSNGSIENIINNLIKKEYYEQIKRINRSGNFYPGEFADPRVEANQEIPFGFRRTTTVIPSSDTKSII